MRHHQLLTCPPKPWRRGITSYWLLLVGIDQSTKYLLLRSPRSLHFTDNLYFGITNSQAPISLITSLPLTIIIILTTIAGLLLTLRYVKRYTALAAKKEEKVIQFAIVTIIAGGVSNLIDHISRGQVADIITMNYLHFNIADVYIVLGSLLIIAKLFKKSSATEPAH